MVAIKDLEMPTDCKHCHLMGIDGDPRDPLSPMMCVAIWATTHETKHCIGGKLRDDCPLIEIESDSDCVSRQALLEFVESKYQSNWWNADEVLAKIKSLPSVTPVCGTATVHFSKEDLREICNERIEIECKHGTCKDCKWWESETRKVGYCNACKHGHCSGSWDIGIYRKTKDDFFCADYERREE